MNIGTLYIIASPIGNLEDITIRAINILKEETDIALCEDTRQTRKLLNRYDINLELQSLHAHSPEHKINSAIKKMELGKSIAYITDAGTPGISDPGSKLVSEVRKAGIPIVPVPGASALSSIVSVSGFSGKNIIFSGFLSKKPGKQRKELESLKSFKGTIVIYESPKRIKKLLGVLSELFPDNEIIIGREMTKLYEEFITGKIKEIYQNLDTIKEKGEFTIAINNN